MGFKSRVSRARHDRDALGSGSVPSATMDQSKLLPTDLPTYLGSEARSTTKYPAGIGNLMQKTSFKRQTADSRLKGGPKSSKVGGGEGEADSRDVYFRSQRGSDEKFLTNAGRNTFIWSALALPPLSFKQSEIFSVDHVRNFRVVTKISSSSGN